MFIFIYFQDLPNNMIHQVAIKSLPQEWLWCETWCDDASKERAKTIDLVIALVIFVIYLQHPKMLIVYI